MSWLSKILGLILFLIFAISANILLWESLADDVAVKMNMTTDWRIREARKATAEVESELLQYRENKMDSEHKKNAGRILKSAFDEVTECIEEFYGGSVISIFKDCVYHVKRIHLNRLKVEVKKSELAYSGASRLKIWL